MGDSYSPWDVLLPINKNALPYGPDGIPFPFASADLTWVFALSIVVSFTAAMGIGMNDVANAFATSVGSKSLKLWQAVIIAGVFEFLGAVLLGSQVTDTIRKKIVEPSAFSESGDILMIGMMCALFSVTFWLFLATKFELPVSTTHSIVGAILGFGLCVPYAAIAWKSVGMIVASWFIAPLLAGTGSALFFFLVRTFILRHENSFERCLRAFPFILWFTVTINCFFIIIKGGKGHGWSKSLGGNGASFGVAAAVGAGMGLLVQFIGVPYMRRTLSDIPNDPEKDVESAPERSPSSSDSGCSENANDDLQLEDVDPRVGPTAMASVRLQSVETQRPDSTKKSMSVAARIGAKDEQVHSIRNQKVQDIHDSAEKFDKRTELAFGYLQIFTACCVAFAHGGNDVSNAVGPLAAITGIYNTNGVAKKAPVEMWILVLGGAGIVCGLAVYGWKIIRALGVKLIKITPSRGSCIELSTAFVIVIGSIYKIPLSTTQVMVGASLGLSFLEGVKTSLNHKLFAKVFMGWVLTLIIAAAVSALLFSLIVYSPTINIQPMAPQNCMNSYGQVNPAQVNFTDVTTALVGDISTGTFQVIKN